MIKKIYLKIILENVIYFLEYNYFFLKYLILCF